ncbi:bifunctional DNA-formamidopyrimidine glycosylase/DNA-(apurinic or apyrimidinic site) lyase [Neisseriaceae bacterium ESL0693]|nr:bifunctional DNA-formamidopyrimidine glycosylase/DNA-(apurinic or apyrimidinic site) lyase [Neisseriaceae bacterium ESL0693]
MPELPEVETTRAGIAPFVTQQTITDVIVRQPKLRWPIVDNLHEIISHQPVLSIQRRAKYLIFQLPTGYLMMHLGMSGSLRIWSQDQAPAPQKHDHVDILFSNGFLLRFHDPRRFGAVLWFAGALEHHPLLCHLGPEPLEADFNAAYLTDKLKTQKRAIKLALMDNKLVVGVGNIYANEALFHAGILPDRPALSLQPDECEILVEKIRQVLRAAIDAGGSSLRDFVNTRGENGHFQQEHFVYGQANQPCRICHTPIQKTIIGQRSSFYCTHCQH